MAVWLTDLVKVFISADSNWRVNKRSWNNLAALTRLVRWLRLWLCGDGLPWQCTSAPPHRRSCLDSEDFRHFQDRQFSWYLKFPLFDAKAARRPPELPWFNQSQVKIFIWTFLLYLHWFPPPFTSCFFSFLSS